MLPLLLTLKVLFMLGFCGAAFPTPGQGEEQTNAKLQEQRKKLGSLQEDMTADQVERILGKPDEIRLLRGALLDGVRYVGSRAKPGSKPERLETERWAYGVLGKGQFARIGIVCLDRDRRVIAAIPTDDFASGRYRRKRPEMVDPKSDDALETAAKMTCHLDRIEIRPANGDWLKPLKTKVTVRNAGTLRFEVKHEAADCMWQLLIVEVNDAKGTLLFREDNTHYISTMEPPENWPIFAPPANQERVTHLSVSRAFQFGPLPPGTYYFRVYFPLEGGKFYPSNLVKFELTKEHLLKSKPD